VWRISQEMDHPHPTSFPLQLSKRCIESTRAELVVDSFIGSGTTAIAAEICSRNWIGMEISEAYCKMANERIRAARKPRDSRSPRYLDEANETSLSPGVQKPCCQRHRKLLILRGRIYRYYEGSEYIRYSNTPRFPIHSPGQAAGRPSKVDSESPHRETQAYCR